jgi:hypothetical protein
MIYLIHFKNLCKCYSVPPCSTIIIKKYNKYTKMANAGKDVEKKKDSCILYTVGGNVN